MNTLLLSIVGALVAAFAFHYLHLNGRRFYVVIIEGVLAAYFGGAVLAPFLNGGSSSEMGMFAVVLAVPAALVAVYASDSIWERYGV